MGCYFCVRIGIDCGKLLCFTFAPTKPFFIKFYLFCMVEWFEDHFMVTIEWS